jgi:hypothetical protein
LELYTGELKKLDKASIVFVGKSKFVGTECINLSGSQERNYVRKREFGVRMTTSTAPEARAIKNK